MVAFVDVDDFIEDPLTDKYAAFVLNMKRQPATVRFKLMSYEEANPLFADYQGERYRVTLASAMGDVGITKNFEQNMGYCQRVSINSLSNFSNKP